MSNVRPMLAETVTEAQVRFPCLGSFKIDGVRVLGQSGQPKSRNGKVHRNLHLQALFKEHSWALEGLDVEAVVGAPNAPDVCRRSSSGASTIEGQPDFQLQAFDLWNCPERPYLERRDILADRHLFDLPPFVHLVRQRWLTDLEELLTLEAEALELGYEGLILRDPRAPYKYGRSSVKQGYLLKFKRHVDFEALVTGVEERMHNANEATQSELGYTTRSSHQENLVPAGTLGALVMRAINGPYEGKEFRVGTFKGFTAPELKVLWDGHVSGEAPLVGRIGKVESFPVGVKDLPRFPKLLAWRSAEDMDFELPAGRLAGVIPYE